MFDKPSLTSFIFELVDSTLLKAYPPILSLRGHQWIVGYLLERLKHLRVDGCNYGLSSMTLDSLNFAAMSIDWIHCSQVGTSLHCYLQNLPPLRPLHNTLHFGSHINLPNQIHFLSASYHNMCGEYRHLCHIFCSFVLLLSVSLDNTLEGCPPITSDSLVCQT